MKKFTILLLYPDYAASDYGSDTYLTYTEARNVKAAIKNAQQEAANAIEATEPDDFKALFVCNNHVANLLESQ